MSLSKRPELFPVCDFMVVTGGTVRLCLNISCFGFALQPQVDRVAADIEQFTRFAFLESI